MRDAYYAFAGPVPTDLWLMLGDNAYNSGTDTEYQAAVFNMYPAFLRKMPLWSCLGNHDANNGSTFALRLYLPAIASDPLRPLPIPSTLRAVTGYLGPRRTLLVVLLSSVAIGPIVLIALSALVAADMQRVNALIVQKMHSPVALIPQLAGHIVAAGGKRLAQIGGHGLEIRRRVDGARALGRSGHGASERRGRGAELRAQDWPQ